MMRHRQTSAIGLVLVMILSAAPSALAASLGKAEIQGLFREGTDLFHQANELATKDPEGAKELYAKAVMRFERIAQEGGVRNGRLYYNIGNAYFHMGDLGRAILNYRRAEEYIPNDPNLIQNLTYACGRCADKLDETQTMKVLRALLFWHYDFATGLRSVVFAVCFLGFWFGAATRVFNRRMAPRWVLACLGIVAALFLGSLLIQTWNEMRNATGVVLSEEVVAHKGDSEAYEPSFKAPLHAGTEFKVLENRRDWLHVELLDGRQCWVPSKSIELVKTDDPTNEQPAATFRTASCSLDSRAGG